MSRSSQVSKRQSEILRETFFKEVLESEYQEENIVVKRHPGPCFRPEECCNRDGRRVAKTVVIPVMVENDDLSTPKENLNASSIMGNTNQKAKKSENGDYDKCPTKVDLVAGGDGNFSTGCSTHEHVVGQGAHGGLTQPLDSVTSSGQFVSADKLCYNNCSNGDIKHINIIPINKDNNFVNIDKIGDTSDTSNDTTTCDGDEFVVNNIAASGCGEALAPDSAAEVGGDGYHEKCKDWLNQGSEQGCRDT